MVTHPILSIPKDQPDFGDGRDYAPGHIEVFEEKTGVVLGIYDPNTQPIAVLIELVDQALANRRRPDWATLATCPIPEDLLDHVYAIDYRGIAWSEEDEFAGGIHVDQLRAYLAALGSDDEDEEALRLSLDEAVELPEAELRRRFQQILIDFTEYPTKSEFPPDFRWDASRLTRDEILEIIALYAYWFDPDRGHPRHLSQSAPEAKPDRPSASAALSSSLR
jgi:hypothetical protein